MKKNKNNKIKNKNLKKNKLERKGESKSKLKVKKILFVSLLLVIVVATVIFWRDIFPEKNSEPEKIYNGYIFEKTPPFGLWTVTIKTSRGEMPLEFYYHPQELEKLSFDKDAVTAFTRVYDQRGKVFIGYDVNLSRSGVAAIAGTELSKITGKIFGLETKAGFVDYIGDDKIPVLNCSNANSTSFVFEIIIDEKNSVEYEDYCAVIYAQSPEDAVKMADLTVYHLLKIMPNRMDVKND